MNPILTIHSGANNTEENSKEYLNSCINSRAQYLEVDVRKTKDDVLILYHDSEIESKPIIENTYKELLSIKPSLVKIDYVYEFTRKNNFKINFDLKTIDAALKLAQSIEDNNFKDKCIISGCHIEEAEFLLKVNKSLNILYNLEREDLPDVDSLFEKLVSLNIFGVNLNYKLCSVSLFEKIERYKLPAFVWTVDSEESFEICKKYNIASITTNYPFLFYKFYKD